MCQMEIMIKPLRIITEECLADVASAWGMIIRVTVACCYSTASSSGDVLVIQVPFAPGSSHSEAPTCLFLGHIRALLSVPLNIPSKSSADVGWVIIVKVDSAWPL